MPGAPGGPAPLGARLRPLRSAPGGGGFAAGELEGAAGRPDQGNKGPRVKGSEPRGAEAEEDAAPSGGVAVAVGGAQVARGGAPAAAPEDAVGAGIAGAC